MLIAKGSQLNHQKKTSSILRFSQNQKGFGIVEVLVAAGLLAILAAGISSLVVNMQTEQKRIQTRSVITELKNRYVSLITDNKSWTATLSANPDMACITDAAGGYCPDGDPHPFIPHYSMEVAGVPTNMPFPAAGMNGFTENGSECAGFIPPPLFTGANVITGTGNPACPISFNPVWQALSPGKPNTMVRITVRFVYNGGPNTTFQNSAETSYKLSTRTFSQGFDASLAPGKNDIQMVRNSTSVGRQFTVSQEMSGAAGRGGNCGAGVPTVRNLNTKEDPTDLITLTSPNFTFNQAGLYKCSVMGTAFGVDSFQVILAANGLGIGTSTGFAGKWSQVSANFDTNVTVLSSDVGTTVYSLRQTCQNLPSNPGGPFPPHVDEFGMGLPSSPYGAASVFGSISCTKMDN